MLAPPPHHSALTLWSMVSDQYCDVGQGERQMDPEPEPEPQPQLQSEQCAAEETKIQSTDAEGDRVEMSTHEDLDLLQQLGFTDTDKNAQALTEAGDFRAAVATLVKQKAAVEAQLQEQTCVLVAASIILIVVATILAMIGAIITSKELTPAAVLVLTIACIVLMVTCVVVVTWRSCRYLCVNPQTTPKLTTAKKVRWIDTIALPPMATSRSPTKNSPGKAKKAKRTDQLAITIQPADSVAAAVGNRTNQRPHRIDTTARIQSPNKRSPGKAKKAKRTGQLAITIQSTDSVAAAMGSHTDQIPMPVMARAA